MSFEEWQRENQQRQSGFEAWQTENQRQDSFWERVHETMKERFEESWDAEIQRGILRGGRRLKGAVPGTIAAMSRAGEKAPGGWSNWEAILPKEEQEKIRQEREEWVQGLEKTAKAQYESALDPEIAPRKAGVGGYIVNTVAETIPTAVAAIGASLVAGPAGAFVVGGAAESEAHVQEAMRKTGMTAEELANERLLVFMISGAIEQMQADEVLKLSKAGLKPVIEAAKQRAWKTLGKEAGRLTAKHAAGAVSEAIEETLQEATSIGAASLHGEKIATLENLKRLGGAALGGAVGYGGLGIAGAGVRTGFEGAISQIDWSQYDNPEEMIQEESEHFVPEPRIMPHVDTTDPEGETVIESEFRYGPRKPKEITTEEQATLERLEEEEVEPEPAKEEEKLRIPTLELDPKTQTDVDWEADYSGEGVLDLDASDADLIALEEAYRSGQPVQPIVVREVGKRKGQKKPQYQVVDGEHRAIAAARAGVPIKAVLESSFKDDIEWRSWDRQWTEKTKEAGTVAPELYIGNVTARAKKVWADEFNRVRQQEGIPGDVEPKDVGPHREGPFPTKRTRVEMTRAEAEETLAQMEEGLEEELLNWPEEGASNMQLALLNALWGDIRATREALGKPVGQRPFRVNTRGNQIVVEIRSPGQRVMEAIRGPSKKTLAEYNHKQLVTQGEALKAKLKAVARTAKKAWRQGNKEGIKKLRRHLRALRSKQRALQMIRQYRRRLVAWITAPVSENVSPLYAQAIRTMAATLDPKGRSAATQKALADLQRALEADPAVAERIKSTKGRKLFERLGQVPVTEISTDQLQALLQERLRLSREGKLKNRQFEYERRAKPVAKAAVETLKGKKQRLGRREQGEYNQEWLKKLSHRFKKGVFGFALGQERIDRFFEWLDGFEAGTFTKMFWQPMKRLALESTIRRNVKQREYYEFLRSHGIDGALWIGDRVRFELSNGGYIELSKWEMIGVYQLAQSESGRSHLMESQLQQELRRLLAEGKITEQQFYAQWFGHQGKMSSEDLKQYKEQFERELEARKNLGLSEADITAISDRVAADEQMRTVAEWQMEQLGERWNAIVRTALEIGMDPTKLVRVGKYMPLLLKNVDMMEQDDLLRRALGEFVPEDYQTERKFLEKRKKGAAGAVELDANLLFMHSISEVEHFLTMAPKLAQLSHVMADDQFRDALNNATYGRGAEILGKWIVDTARGRVVREHDWIARHVHKLQRYGIIYALGFNIPVVLRQAISTFNGLAMNPRMIRHYIGSFIYADHPQDFDNLRDKVMSKSKVVSEREMEHHIADLWNKPYLRKQLQREFGHRIKGAQFSKTAMAWIRKMDMWTVTHVWNAAYETALEQGANEQQAINYADQVIQRTQPMARPEDLPHFFRGGVIQQLTTVFMNQVNQNLNFWVHDIYGARKYGKITNTEVAYRVMMSYVLPSIILGMVSRGGAPPDEEQVAQDLTLYAGGAPLIYGNVVRHAITGWGNSMSLWQTGIKGAGQAAAAAERGDFRGVLRGASKAIAVAPAGGRGAPTAAMIRGAEGAYDLWTGSTDDPRRLLWSEWALEQGKTKEEGRTRTRKRKTRRRRKRR